MFKHLQKFVVFSCALFIVGFFSEAYSQTTPTHADLQKAYSLFRPSVEGKACIDYFKSTMNDPSSFQLAGDFVYNDYDPGVYEGNGLLAVVVPIRARNAMGGLVLRALVCSYHIEGGLTLNSARDE